MRHYVESPNATDSLEGIAEWRLLEAIIQRRVQETDEAVQWLVKQGFLERITREAAPPLYRLNTVNRSEAERFLREAGGEP